MIYTFKISKIITTTLLLLMTTPSFAALHLKNDAKIYRISNFDNNKVLVKRNNKEYKIDRKKFALKKFKINQQVKIHDVGLKLYAQEVKRKK